MTKLQKNLNHMALLALTRVQNLMSYQVQAWFLKCNIWLMIEVISCTTEGMLISIWNKKNMAGGVGNRWRKKNPISHFPIQVIWILHMKSQSTQLTKRWATYVSHHFRSWFSQYFQPWKEYTGQILKAIGLK